MPTVWYRRHTVKLKYCCRREAVEMVENESSRNVSIYVSREGEETGSSSGFHLQSFIMEL
jgi:hypothetical protein